MTKVTSMQAGPLPLHHAKMEYFIVRVEIQNGFVGYGSGATKKSALRAARLELTIQKYGSLHPLALMLILPY